MLAYSSMIQGEQLFGRNAADLDNLSLRDTDRAPK